MYVKFVNHLLFSFIDQLSHFLFVENKRLSEYMLFLATVLSGMHCPQIYLNISIFTVVWPGRRTSSMFLDFSIEYPRMFLNFAECSVWAPYPTCSGWAPRPIWASYPTNKLRYAYVTLL